ncbi:uncharacterized protein LY89DRAFT_690718 [Mollisia scopiformis]|uniref:Metallo-beta-lactamase domain-containing protein n=1 Tax=Mollisia scopiformis TaxID=149040 RepID=A0A132B8E9_MOLSC|nr:uncharacterized protein LY89DRAFT_690718 [Mollisia scopiformis]KUJ08675.1 hypothetical protein LY89DRAFT_690718 [Mollisia scopiformis]
MSLTLEDEDPSSQLRASLLESITRSLSSRRPLLTHLNADTTWLLSIPYPSTNPSLRNRTFYHILIDPWLKGGQSDVAAFFSQQWHATPSSVQTITEVEDVIRRMEFTAKGKEKADMGVAESLEEGQGDVIVVDNHGLQEKQEGNVIDLVVVSHEFTDHMHKETLLEIPKTVPVLATVKAAGIIKSWKHFHVVGEVPRFSGDWRKCPHKTLPEWLDVSRVAKPGMDLLYYHSAIMIAFPKGYEGEGEAVIYTPHGITPADLAPVAEANPKIHTLALLHGLQDISLPRAQLNKGAHNGLKAQRLLGAKYWIGTHDELKKGGGIVSYFLRRKHITLKDAIEKEKEEHGEKLKGSDLETMKDVRFEDLTNGESLLLE